MTHFGVIAPAFSSHFHVLETLGIELISRGHRVTFIQQGEAKGLLQDARIGFHAVGLASHGQGRLRTTQRRAANPGGLLGVRRVIADMADETDMLCRELPAALEQLGIEVLICDQMEAAGGLVAEAARLPYASVACALPVNREPGVPLPVMSFPWGIDERDRVRYLRSTQIHDWLMSPHMRVVARHAASFGLGRRQTLDDCLSPLLQISQTVAAFDFPRQALPPHFHHVGPIRAQSATEEDFEFPVDRARPFVFASLGTLQGHRHGLLLRIAKACRHLDLQLLVAHCGGLNARQVASLERAGATWVTAFARQRRALELADVVVSHAGLNTVLDALEAGTPILALPIAFDQPGVAARVIRAKAGLRASPRFTSARALTRQLLALVQDTSFRDHALGLAAAIKQAGGLTRAADLIEHLSSETHPVPVRECA